MKISIEHPAKTEERELHSASIAKGELAYQLGEGGAIVRCACPPALEQALVDAVQAHQHEIAQKDG